MTRTEYPAGRIGENLYYAWTSGTNLDKTAFDAVIGWGSEKEDYRYGPVRHRGPGALCCAIIPSRHNSSFFAQLVTLIHLPS